VTASAIPTLALGEVRIDLSAVDRATSLATAVAFVARRGGAAANVAVALAVIAAFGPPLVVLIAGARRRWGSDL